MLSFWWSKCMCSNTTDDVYEDIDDYNPNRKRKILIVFDVIADITTNKKFQAIIKELFIKCRKLNISLVFITQSYFSVPKHVRLSSKHYLIMKINSKRELQNIAIVILQILIIKMLWRFTEDAQKKRILFWQLIQHYQQLIR